MKIGIIGAGNVGTALAKAATGAGHHVTITSDEPEEAAAVAADTGAETAPTNADAAGESEVVILAVPYDAVPDILDEVGDQLDGKVLVDVTNRFEPEQLDGTSNAETIQSRAPGAKVVKAFNTVFAANQADPKVDGVQLDGFVAGDDAPAKRKVLNLLESLGFRPVDVGNLSMARALEAMGMLNIHLNATHDWPWQSGWKLVGPTG